MEPEPT